VPPRAALATASGSPLARSSVFSEKRIGDRAAVRPRRSTRVGGYRWLASR
jgi:hypothetical protein